jgi:hypothetical protein
MLILLTRIAKLPVGIAVAARSRSAVSGPALFWRYLLVLALGIGVVVLPTSRAFENRLSYSATTCGALIFLYLAFLCLTLLHLYDGPVDDEKAWVDVDKVESSCQAMLVVMTLFVGLFQFFQGPSLKLPDGGFDLLVCGALYLLVAIVPFGPRTYGAGQSKVIRVAREYRAIKAILLAASILCIALVVGNIVRLNASPTSGLTGLGSPKAGTR